MKKLMFLLLLVFLLPFLGIAPATAQGVPGTERVWLMLGTAETGNTTTTSNSSGASVFRVYAGQAFQIFDSEAIVDGGTSVFKVADFGKVSLQVLPSGATVSQVQQNAGGDYSGTTIDMCVQFSNENNSDAWTGASVYQVITGVALSGNSTYITEQDIPLAEYMRAYLRPSGITAFDGVKLKVLLQRRAR